MVVGGFVLYDVLFLRVQGKVGNECEMCLKGMEVSWTYHGERTVVATFLLFDHLLKWYM